MLYMYIKLSDSLKFPKDFFKLEELETVVFNINDILKHVIAINE